MTGREFNSLLLEHGYLEGAPGQYQVTEKGRQYANEEDHYRGNERSLSYSASWSTRSWDEAILPDLKREMAEGAGATTGPDGSTSPSQDEARAEGEATTEPDDWDYEYDYSRDEDEAPSTPSWQSVIGMVVLAAGVRVASDPRVRGWVRERTQPPAEKIWRKIRRAKGDAAEGHAEDRMERAEPGLTVPTDADGAADKPSD
jgi:hypothetical protein